MAAPCWWDDREGVRFVSQALSRFWIRSAVFMLCVLAAAQQPPSTSSRQSAQTNQQKARAFLDQMIQALGGPAYMNLQDGEFEGRSGRFYHEKSEGSTVFHRFWQWPDKDRIEFTKQRDIVQLILGDEIYEITFRGTRIIDPKKDYDFQMLLERRHRTLEIILR